MAKSKRTGQKLPPIHPGEILLEDYMKPLGLSAHRLAMHLHVPATGLRKLSMGARAITADSAVRLGRYFKTGPRFWLNLQTAYDLELIEDECSPRFRAK